MPGTNIAASARPIEVDADTLRCAGGRPLVGKGRIPGDKSISHRALLLGALGDGTTVIRNLSPCRDVARTKEAIRRLGATTWTRPTTRTRGGEPHHDGLNDADPRDGERYGVEVRDGGPRDRAPLDGDPRDRAPLGDGPRVRAPRDGGPRDDGPRDGTPSALAVGGRGPNGLGGPSVTIDCGDSGTTMRLLAGVLAGQDRTFQLDGSAQLRRRPMGRVVRPLQSLGATLESTEGKPPIRGVGGGLRGASITLEHASAQVAGAVLLAALNATGATTVTYPAVVRDHTERMLKRFGAPIVVRDLTSTLDGPVTRLQPPLDGLDVPGDISCGAFLVAAALLLEGSAVHLDNVGLNPGRIGFLLLARRMGADITIEPVDDVASRAPGPGPEPLGRVSVRASTLHGIDVASDEVPAAIDEITLLAVIATAARGETRVRGAGELRVKESDRLDAIVVGLRRLGADIRSTDDGFVVRGPTPLIGTAVDARGDHRVAMGLAVAGLSASGITHVSGASTVDDSFPGFVAAMNRLVAP
jgi:3-phosphoshikimate 1-carboxyvinyltransferase